VVCCGVLRCVAVYLSLGLLDASKKTIETVLSGQCVACVAVCGAVCGVVCCSLLQCVLQCFAVCCGIPFTRTLRCVEKDV